MQPVIAAIGRGAAAYPHRPALADSGRTVSYRTLSGAIGEAAAELRAGGSRTVALALDNSPEWIALDLALLAGRIPCLPLPAFFSPRQHWHAITQAGADSIVTDRPDYFCDLLRSNGAAPARAPDLDLFGLPVARIKMSLPVEPRLPADTAKVTYTSGTTGQPKGVCLDAAALGTVAGALAAACALTSADRHLSLLPLATLLENVGVYATLLAGGRCMLLPLREVGTLGASGVEPDRMLKSLHQARATTAITVPQMLRALVGETASGAPAPRSLRFLAVGGAPVAPALLEQARSSGLAVFEGYGLSECASVLTLNRPGENRPGSVGRPLPHARLSFAADGEILADGALFLGYSPGGAPVIAPWATGDIGRLDPDGFLYLEGRRKDFFVTSYGRNVSPEWIETALTGEPEIAQAWVSGESRPWIAAVVTPRNGTPDSVVAAAIGRVNASLPDYARVQRWIRSHEPFSARSEELTGNGRLRRHALRKRYGARIESLYQERTHEVLR
jgi:long-subunit acyl-CoA synthetase (AMP-forming)